MSGSAPPREGPRWTAWPRVLLTEAVHGVPLLVGILVVAVSLLVTAPQRGFPPVWSNTLYYGTFVVVFVAPLVAGGAAVLSQQRLRRGWLEWAASTPRGARSVLTTGTAAVILWGVLALLAGFCTVLLSRPPGGAPTPAGLLLPLTATTMVVAAGLLGGWLGSLTTNPLLGPALALATFGVPNLAFYLRVDNAERAWALWLEPFPLDFSYTAVTEPNAPRWVVVLTGLLAAAVVLALVLRGRDRTAIVLGVGLLGLTVIATTQVDGSEVVRYQAAPTDPVCGTSADIAVCVWPSEQADLPVLVDAVDQVHDAAVPVLAQVPTTFVQPGLDLTTVPASAVPPGLVELFAPYDATTAAGAAISAVLPPPPCENDDTAIAEYSRVGSLVALRAGYGDATEDPDLATTIGLPDGAQRQWVTQRLDAAARACA